MVDDARMRSVGWFKAAVTLIRSVIVPSLTYSADVWIVMNKQTRRRQKEYKAMIYAIMELQITTKWTSVLANTGLPEIMTIVTPYGRRGMIS